MIHTTLSFKNFAGQSSYRTNSCYFCSPGNQIAGSRSLVTDKDVIAFMRDGHIVTRGLIDPSVIREEVQPGIMELYNANSLTAWKHKLRVHLNIVSPPPEITVEDCERMLKDVDSEDIPFLQLFNLWYQSDAARTLALSPDLGRVAAELLGVDGVRLYQDTLFVKRSGDGPTRWHSDLNMAPFDSNDFVTCWIPLQDVPVQEDGGSGLTFASGSHRDFALPYWSDPVETDLSERYAVVTDYGGFEVGDCSWHHGWCLHSAPDNTRPETRYAYAVSFVADGARLLNSEGHIRYPDNEDDASYAAWIDDIGWGGYADHPLLPLTWSKGEFSESQ